MRYISQLSVFFKIGLLFIICCISSFSWASSKPIVVAVSPFSPFVIINDGKVNTGFSIDLWYLVAEKTGVSFQFKIYDSVQAKLDGLKKGEADIAIGGISLTLEREQIFDFSHASYYSGLDILFKENEQIQLFSLLKQIFSGQGLILFQSLLWLGFTLVIIAGHAIWLAEKGKDSFHDNYFYGVGQAMYWVIVTASTVGYGDFAPMKPIGRLVTVLIIIFSLPLFGIFISDLSSHLTTMKLHKSIQSPDDLFGKSVGVVSHTTSEDSVLLRHLKYKAYPNIQQAITALKQDKIDAVIYDAPHLQYFDKHNLEADDLKLVGNQFDYKILAFAALNKNPLIETVNHALLSLQESGQYQKLKKAWFQL